MDQTVLVSMSNAAATLTTEDIERGEKLLAALDSDNKRFKARRPVNGAFWQLQPERDKWVLCLAMPNIRRDGPRLAYRHILGAIRRHHIAGMLLTDISLVDKDDPSYTRLSRTIQAPGINRLKLIGNWVMGERLPDIFAYRITK
ncbi:hypothetical protein PXJ20_11975 [Paraburkholderia sp. A1RI_3L]|uniref:hypothetical protein n=1 Tax=Paraburkholderia TaxID=1822464 RepID=UPI003B7E8F8E